MRKDFLLLILGCFVFLVPFLGVPESWKATGLFVLGTGVVFMALLYRIDTRKYKLDESEFLHEEHAPESIESTELPAEEYV